MSSYLRALSNATYKRSQPHPCQNKKRSDLLIIGFIRQNQGSNDFLFFPEEITQDIFDLYYSLDGEWLRQNVSIQIVDPKHECLYLFGEYNTYLNKSTKNNCYYQEPEEYRMAVDFDPIFEPQGVEFYGQEKWRSPVWRTYPNSNGFKLRPVDITETEDVATNSKSSANI